MNQPAQKDQPIPEAVMLRLWTHLCTQFNVEVWRIGSGIDANNQRVAKVSIETKDAAAINTLPTTFEGEKVTYRAEDAPTFGW